MNVLVRFAEVIGISALVVGCVLGTAVILFACVAVSTEDRLK